MDLIARIADIIIPVFLIVAIGYGYARRRPTDLGSFNRIALDVLAPLLVYSALASRDFAIGEHVHTHNLAVGELQQRYEIGTDVRPIDYYPADRMRYFEGFRRADGRVGTRNYVAVISTAVGSETTAGMMLNER